MPGISMSGNINPQSRIMIRPATSTHAQLRPISPRPPRKTMRTGSSAPEMGKDLPGCVLEPSWSRAERQPALAGGEAQGPQHGFRRDRVGSLVARLEAMRRHQPGVDLAGVFEVALGEGGEHFGHLLAGPVAL